MTPSFVHWKSLKMIKAVLLDLDDTLITNPIDRFNQDIGAWNAFFGQLTGKPDAALGLFAAIEAVTRNQNPVENNLDVFLKTVSARWDVDPDTAMEHFRTFYAELYTRMKEQIAHRESAPVLLDWLQDNGYQVVIATNPLFMADAVAQRMRWGGIPDNLERYSLVTNIENMQFAKPTPHYYEEIIGRLGISTDEAIMVGDDWDRDIAPAEEAGLNTYWIRPDGAMLGKAPANPDGQGTLNDFTLRVCNLGWLDTLKPRPLQPSMIPPRLLGNAGALFSLLREHAPDRWWQHPDPDEWSPLEVVCHLRDSETSVQRPRLQRITEEDNPFLTVPQEPPGPGQIGCDTEELCDPAEDFAAERQRTAEFLEQLSPAAWGRPARHSIFGPTTLLEMANFTSTHDRLHLQQICQTIGRCE